MERLRGFGLVTISGSSAEVELTEKGRELVRFVKTIADQVYLGR